MLIYSNRKKSLEILKKRTDRFNELPILHLLTLKYPITFLIYAFNILNMAAGGHIARCRAQVLFGRSIGSMIGHL